MNQTEFDAINNLMNTNDAYELMQLVRSRLSVLRMDKFVNLANNELKLGERVSFRLSEDRAHLQDNAALERDRKMYARIIGYRGTSLVLECENKTQSRCTKQFDRVNPESFRDDLATRRVG